MLRLTGMAVAFVATISAAAAEVPPDNPTNLVSTRELRPFVFDAKEGTYQSRNVPLDCGTNAVQLKAHFTRLGKQKTKWAPAISLSIVSAGILAAVQIAPKDFNPPIQIAVVTFDLDHQTEVERVMLYNTFELETPVPVLATWSSDGLITFNVGGETRSVNLRGPVTQVSVAGSTGAGVIDPLETGRTRGTDLTKSCATPHL